MARTTLNIDTPLMKELKRLQKEEKKSLGRLVSDLLSEALAEHREGKRPATQLNWTAKDMKPRVVLTDKDALYAILNERDE